MAIYRKDDIMNNVKTQRDINIEFRDEINKLIERLAILEAKQGRVPPMQYNTPPAPTWFPATFTHRAPLLAVNDNDKRTTLIS